MVHSTGVAMCQISASSDEPLMSPCGYKQTSSRPKLRSALPPASDIPSAMSAFHPIACEAGYRLDMSGVLDDGVPSLSTGIVGAITNLHGPPPRPPLPPGSSATACFASFRGMPRRPLPWAAAWNAARWAWLVNLGMGLGQIGRHGVRSCLSWRTSDRPRAGGRSRAAPSRGPADRPGSAWRRPPGPASWHSAARAARSPTCVRRS